MVGTFATTWLTVAGVMILVLTVDCGQVYLTSRIYICFMSYDICILGGKYLVLYKLLEEKCIYLGFGLT